MTKTRQQQLRSPDVLFPNRPGIGLLEDGDGSGGGGPVLSLAVLDPTICLTVDSLSTLQAFLHLPQQFTGRQLSPCR